MDTKHDLWESFKRLAAPPSWDASFTPMLVGFTCAFTLGGAKLDYPDVAWMLLAFASIALVETGKHALNEILDYQTGNDIILAEDHLTPFSGGKKVLRCGLASVNDLWWMAGATLGIACIAGLIISAMLSWKILIIGIVGMAMAVLYNAPQFRLCYKGLGEPCIFIAYGPVCTMGAYHMFVDEFSWIPFLISLTLGLLIVNVLIINEFPDYEADLAAHKMNWVARLGKEKGLTLYSALYYVNFISIPVLIFITASPLWLLLTLTYPTFRRAMNGARHSMDDIPSLIPCCADTVTIHARCGIFADIVVVMLYLMNVSV